MLYKDAEAQKVIKESQDFFKAETDRKAKRDCQCEECDQSKQTTSTSEAQKRYDCPSTPFKFFGEQFNVGKRESICATCDDVCR